jgi:hypothetical protein
MVKAATTFIIGFALGAATVAFAKRLKIVLEEEDPERLTTRLHDRLSKLELRTQDGTSA